MKSEQPAQATAEPTIKAVVRSPIWFVPPLIIYASFVAVAFLVGAEHSHDGGGDFYWGLGEIGLPVLFVSAFSFPMSSRVALRVLSGLAFVLIGIGVWAWAFNASGQYFVLNFW